MIRFAVPGKIVPWARAGGNGKIRFTPPRQRRYAGQVAALAKAAMAGRDPLSGPLQLDLIASWKWPKAIPRAVRETPFPTLKIGRPDADNISKIAEDAMNGIVYHDDAQVAVLTVCKKYGDYDYLEITLTQLETESWDGQVNVSIY